MFYHTINFTGQVKWDTHHKSKYQGFEIDVFQQLKLETTKIHACSVILLQNFTFTDTGCSYNENSIFMLFRLFILVPWQTYKEGKKQPTHMCIALKHLSLLTQAEKKKPNPKTSKAVDTGDLHAASTH